MFYMPVTSKLEMTWSVWLLQTLASSTPLSTGTQACSHRAHGEGGRSPWPRGTGQAGRASGRKGGTPPPHLGGAPQWVAEAAAVEEVRGGGEVQLGGKLGWWGRGLGQGLLPVRRPGLSATSGPSPPQ